MAKSTSKRKTVIYTLLGALSVVLVAADVHYALRTAAVKGKFAPESAFDAITSATEARISIARSDDAELARPAPLDSEVDYEQIEAMVRRAVDLVGGFEWLIRPGDTVLLKPNIVDPEPPGVGEITDVRVVKAVVRLLHEVAGGDVEIVIGEGSPRPMDYEMPFAPSWNSPAWEKLWDVAGFQDLLVDPDLEGVNLRLSNLNGPWEDLVHIEIPQGGYFDPNQGKLWIHKDVLNADVRINIPVMKIHNPGITVALKNNIGLYPATRYGFSRSRGVPQDDFKTRLLHYDDLPRDWVEEQIVDINLVANIDFVVVDALMCLERSKAARRSGGRVTNQVRRNMILAGADQVAIDHVSARLMGINPDDVAHITLAARVGLGNNDADEIEIAGSTVEESWFPFKKDPFFTSDFGQGNRTWLLSGPFPAGDIDSPMDRAFVAGEADILPRAGRDEWSAAIYFFDDRIDLGSFYNIDAGPAFVAYAFTFFDAPQDQEAELWLGSDEAVRIYLNGEIAYDYDGLRAYPRDALVKAKVPVRIRQGENALLVKAFQELGDFEFALNICEPETDPDLDGDRVFGLEFHPAPLAPTALVAEGGPSLPQSFALAQNYPNPFNANTVISFDLPSDLAVETARLDIYNLQGQLLRTLVERPAGAGRHLKVWDGRDRNGRQVTSGTYLYRLQVAGRSATKKMLLLR